MTWFDELTGRRKTTMITPDQALPGRDTPIRISGTHAVNQHRMTPPFPPGMHTLVVGEGCFWGAERGFWRLPGVYSTAVGYSGGYTHNPTYEEVCTGMTGHTEAVLVVFDPGTISIDDLLAAFWESHDPTQGMRQGNDVGSQYRSAIYTVGERQHEAATDSARRYQKALDAAGHGTITTEIAPLSTFYYAEEYHQQYLHKNPNGYCGLGGTGVSCPVGLGA
ncbi:peptide-methionine (S)-S-oxide reductase MsrA [Hoyosella sp. G463]|uniref:Peptide methionine sulfoxide reductase MsrA n=1 Tax=Lolliginicoccus lacisalsi TaxID=2742202 RepID=A0A927JD04_9ACTN|nr:peptide-methionine (S)-S-oxide reductase MsrA [Lolliginicoccus lacisalsi]MBD8506969.1 peptide-methionine (S)-S-oxide reductase MsrA [Lolliginicoccus lacisalsi]